MQQDAEECWSSLLTAFSQSIPPLTSFHSSVNETAISQLFTGVFKVTLSCIENSEEVPSSFRENFTKLSCQITKDVNFLYQGLELGMTDIVEKKSLSLQRDAQYQKKMEIEQLPCYLTTQFVRFYWKKANDTNRKEGVKSKILRPVTYPLRFDVFQFCTPALQLHISAIRKKIRLEADQKLGLLNLLDNKSNSNNNTTSSNTTSNESSNTSETKQEEVMDTSVEEAPTGKKLLLNETGFYDLRAILTHKGRSADSGHYVAWVKRKPNDWVLFDDKEVRPANDQEILSLCGKAGGDAHIAYLLLYTSVTPDQLRESN